MLEEAGLLTCSDGRTKSINDCHALRSLPCLPTGGLSDVSEVDLAAAAMGRQPLHSDATLPAEGEKPLDKLPPADQPLSVIVAVEPNTRLWIYPDGCDGDGILVPLNVGDVLVWKGTLVHAGAGYAVTHHRIHAYVDPPHDIYRRRKGTEPCTPQDLFDFPVATAQPPGEATAAGSHHPLREATFGHSDATEAFCRAAAAAAEARAEAGAERLAQARASVGAAAAKAVAAAAAAKAKEQARVAAALTSITHGAAV